MEENVKNDVVNKLNKKLKKELIDILVKQDNKISKLNKRIKGYDIDIDGMLEKEKHLINEINSLKEQIAINRTHLSDYSEKISNLNKEIMVLKGNEWKLKSALNSVKIGANLLQTNNAKKDDIIRCKNLIITFLFVIIFCLTVILLVVC